MEATKEEDGKGREAELKVWRMRREGDENVKRREETREAREEDLRRRP